MNSPKLHVKWTKSNLTSTKQSSNISIQPTERNPIKYFCENNTSALDCSQNYNEKTSQIFADLSFPRYFSFKYSPAFITNISLLIRINEEHIFTATKHGYLFYLLGKSKFVNKIISQKQYSFQLWHSQDKSNIWKISVILFDSRSLSKYPSLNNQCWKALKF